MISRLHRSGLQRPDWRRTASYGLLLGIAAAAVESFALPLGEIGGVALIQLVTLIVLHWSVMGVGIAGALAVFEPHGETVAITMTLVTFTLLNMLLWVPTIDAMRDPWAPGDRIPLWLQLRSDIPHFMWGGLFYGGLFVLAWHLHHRSERIRGVLAQAEISRQRAEALLSTEKLKVLQGHVDPAFLLRAMAEVERRYGRDESGVDRLLDALVDFLRAAMPGVRSGASTLADEVQLTRDYARVLAELEPGRGSWHIDDGAAVPDSPFPPLLLIPVLDRLASLAGQPVVLELRRAAARCILSARRTGPCDDAWLGSELDFRLRVGLRSTLGNAWSLDVGNGTAGPAFVLSIDMPGSSPTPRTENTNGQDAELLRSPH
jgi:hypothetical protein